MAIHVPLSAEAQAEARILMLSANNLLRPQDGGPVTVPTQDMVLGSYYLTMDRMGKAEKGAENIFCSDPGDTELPAETVVDADDFVAANGRIAAMNDALSHAERLEALNDDERERVAKKLDEAKAAGTPAEKFRKASYRPVRMYRSEEEALMAYNEGVIGPHCPILVRRSFNIAGTQHTGIVEITPGRILFNQNIPQDLGFVDRDDPAHVCDYEITETCGKKELGKIVDRTINKHGFTMAAEVLDAMKATGYRYSTKAAITVSIWDMSIPESKYKMVQETEQQVVNIENQYRMGFMTDHERYKQVVDVWEKTTDQVSTALQDNLDRYNPIFMMADSGRAAP